VATQELATADEKMEAFRQQMAVFIPNRAAFPLDELEKYRDKKLWCLLYPIAWVDTEHPADWMFHRLPARVKPFKHHVIGANWSVDRTQEWRGYGFSVIISNDGKVAASAKSLYGSEIVYAELPTAK
jgi:predicted amidohydrolase